jgi:hypothetical protein
MSSKTPSSRERTFLRPQSAGSNGTLLMLAGVAGMCVAALGFALAIYARPGQLALHSMTTLPAILSVGALTAGWRLLRTPGRVIVGSDGLTIETSRGERRLRWSDVGSAGVETGGMTHRRLLNITDVDGKSIAKLDQSFDDFDAMVAIISRHVEAKGDDTSARILRKKARRNAILAFTVGLFMAVACIFVAWTTRAEQRAGRLLAEKGEPGEAELVRRFVAPNGVTKRIEYRVTSAGKPSGTRNVEVEPDYWESLAGAKSVPVVFVPDEPGISRLERGEVIEKDLTKRPAGGYLLAALGGLLALFLLGASPLMWNGWDLTHDSKTNRWSVKRFGKVIWSTGGSARDETEWEADES